MQKTNKLNRLVYAEDVLKNIDRDRAYMSDVGRIHARAAVNDAPTVDAKPVVYGKWLSPNSYPGFVYHCSNCKHSGLPTDNYCSHCGADMRGMDDGN